MTRFGNARFAAFAFFAFFLAILLLPAAFTGAASDSTIR
jgi:hypothetical protein